MGHHAVVIPTKFWIGSGGGPGFYSNILETDSGQVTVIRRRQQARWKFNLDFDARKGDFCAELIRFHLARGGAANSFLYRHWFDHNSTQLGYAWADIPGSNEAYSGTAVANTDQLIGTGDGSTTQFQLVKRYEDGNGYSYAKTIRKPIAGTVVVALDGVGQTSGWTVNTATGIVTFSVAPTSGVEVTAGFEFYFEVRFDRSADEQLSAIAANKYMQDFGSITLNEELVSNPVNEDVYQGGATYLAFASNITLEGIGTAIALFPTTTSLHAILPDPATYPQGATPIFFLFNLGANSVAIDDTTVGNLFQNLSAGSSVAIFNALDGSGNPIWMA